MDLSPALERERFYSESARSYLTWPLTWVDRFGSAPLTSLFRRGC